MKPASFCALGILLTSIVPISAVAADAPSAQAVELFEKHVRPMLVTHCQQCHGPRRQQGGLRLDSRAEFLKGSDTGPVVDAARPEESLLLRVLRHDGDTKMPPKGKLPDAVLANMTEWVRLGAPWPDDAGKGATQITPPSADVRQRHWAFQPVRKPALPAVRNQSWVQTPIDAFVLARLEARGLAPAPAANRRTLVRRLSLDLTGLPPTPEEVAEFEADRTSDAYPRLVDRLLASPAYGERWGRHWLDVARYADTKGYVFQEERRYPYSYTYRDYVIQAFNDDLPYDQFVLQQLAADLLPLGGDKRPLAAMGFLTLGRRFLNNVHDIIDDRIDVTMRGLQGLTVGCARCHDHKFDPIPTRDYYSLYGIFASCVEPKDLPLIAQPEKTAATLAFEAELKKREQAVADFKEKNKEELSAKNRKFQNQLRDLQKKVDEWKVTSPAAAPRAMVLQDLPAPREARVLLRGNPGNPGPVVPRQFLEVLAGPQRQPFRKGSGRLELAQAIASKDNPLTARVLVNRVWLGHFGAGLVRTPSNFGLRGEPPTHPELLDWLAASFVENGWSIKKLHRQILLSAAYQQSGDNAAVSISDPENLLLGRMSRQRLDLEALRDTLLFVAGRLDRQRGGPAVDLVKAPFSGRRTVYGFIDRQNLPGMFRTFDFASPDATSAQRHNTTVPQQALFLMNSPFAQEQARHFSARPELVGLTDDRARIDRMHRLAYGRPAEPDEVTLGLHFLSAARGTAGTLTPWEQYAQVLLLANELAFVD
jgi:mono/diheme cytochrome c family protein